MDSRDKIIEEQAAVIAELRALIAQQAARIAELELQLAIAKKTARKKPRQGGQPGHQQKRNRSRV